MPRRAKVVRRVPLPDARYDSRLVSRFINKLMVDGKKGVAERIMYTAFDRIEANTHHPPMETFDVALRNATPAIEVRPRRIGGATYQVPSEIRPERRTTMAIRWLINAARSRNGKSMSEKLASELLDASHNLGATVKRKEDTHRMAEANKAFSHYGR